MIINSILTSEYSFWWLLPLFLVSAALSFYLYKNDKFLKEIPKSLKVLLISLRFIGIFFLGLFLIKPLISNIKQDLFKPQLIILQDNSSSIKLNKDSLYYKTSFVEELNSFKEKLKENDIPYSSYSFSDSIYLNENFSFDKQITNISAALTEATNLDIGNNIGGILLLSDGIYNKGRDPFYLSKNSQLPIYTVGLGDTSIFNDLSIRHININKIGFSNQNISFNIDIKAIKSNNENFTLKISENDNLLFEKSLKVQKDDYFESISNILSKLEVGLHEIKFELSLLENEYNIKNNEETVYINIIDSKQKILILSAAPHPDIASLKYVLEKQANYDIESFNIRDFKGNIAEYNLIILHQLPDQRNPIDKEIIEIQKHKTPVLSIINPQTELKNLNKLSSNIIFSRVLRKNELLELSLNTKFSLFNISEEMEAVVNKAPPIIAPMLKVTTKGEIQTLAFQKIKGIETNKPAIFFTEDENSKYGFINGEGIWQLKLFNYQKEGNFNVFSELIGKMVQYLSIKTPKESFIIDIKNLYEEYEAVEINAQLYNNSLEPVYNKEVNIIYKDENDKEYSHNFSSNHSGYNVNLGSLDKGSYSYEVSTEINDKKILKSGAFVVQASLLEYRQLTANHKLLKSISENTNAIYFEKSNWLQIVDSIKQSPNFKTKSYSNKELNDLINLKWILFLIVLILSTEWFIRKYSGTI